MSDPTPRPWIQRSGDASNIWAPVEGEDEGYLEFIATTHPHSHPAVTQQERHANARLIVRAMNCHDALGGALREIIKGEGRFSQDPYKHACNTIEDMIEQARAALAQVEEES